MSAEFRASSGYYLHDFLDNLTDRGQHQVSQALYRIYKALQPVELACARFEAHDAISGHIGVALIANWREVDRAMTVLLNQYHDYASLVEIVHANESLQTGSFGADQSEPERQTQASYNDGRPERIDRRPRRNKSDSS